MNLEAQKWVLDTCQQFCEKILKNVKPTCSVYSESSFKWKMTIVAVSFASVPNQWTYITWCWVFLTTSEILQLCLQTSQLNGTWNDILINATQAVFAKLTSWVGLYPLTMTTVHKDHILFPRCFIFEASVAHIKAAIKVWSCFAYCLTLEHADDVFLHTR